MKDLFFIKFSVECALLFHSLKNFDVPKSVSFNVPSVSNNIFGPFISLFIFKFLLWNILNFTYELLLINDNNLILLKFILYKSIQHVHQNYQIYPKSILSTPLGQIPLQYQLLLKKIKFLWKFQKLPYLSSVIFE